MHLSGLKLSNNILFDDLAKRTENYSGAEVAAIVENARMHAIREFIDVSVSSGSEIDELALSNLMLTNEHFHKAFEELLPKEKSEYDLKPPGISDSSFA